MKIAFLSKIKSAILITMLISFISCISDNASKEFNENVNSTNKAKITRVKVPRINEDSVFSFVVKQVNFGPRVPGSIEHHLCKNWIVKKLELYQATVITQDFNAAIHTGEILKSSNIIAQINPNKKNRILLAAHWDSRMNADNDKNELLKDDPIDGADDGASGVAVLLELARIINSYPIELGIDIILFDAEDQGSTDNSLKDTWCLGAQYWCNNQHIKNYDPLFGILVDMVGAYDATFYKEAYSKKYAPDLQRKIWALASKMNSGDIFIDLPGGAIMDDHFYVNTIAQIPMINIINTSRSTKTGFGSYWHTHNDNIDIIDKNNLRKVTQLIAAVLYKSSDNSF